MKRHLLAAATLLIIATGCEVSPGFDGYVLFENDKGTAFVSSDKQVEIWRFKSSAALPNGSFVLKRTGKCSKYFNGGGKERLLVNGGEVVGFGHTNGTVVALKGKCGLASSTSNWQLASQKIALDMTRTAASSTTRPNGRLFKVTPNSCGSGGGGAMAYVTVNGDNSMVHWLSEPGSCFLKGYSSITFTRVRSASGKYHAQPVPKTTP